MNFLEIFHLKALKYDLLNKFLYKKTKHFPKIKKIIFNFRCDQSNFKYLSSILLTLQLITYQKSKITTSKQSNIFLKIRKGNPVGCKVTLRKYALFYSITNFLINIFPKLKNFNGFKVSETYKFNTFSYTIQDILIFSELSNYYHLFNNLPKLKITLVTNAKTKTELLFLLTTLKFPIIKMQI